MELAQLAARGPASVSGASLSRRCISPAPSSRARRAVATTCSAAPEAAGMARRALLGGALAGVGAAYLPTPASAGADPASLYDTSFTVRGVPLPLSAFRDKVLVIVNVASQ